MWHAHKRHRLEAQRTLVTRATHTFKLHCPHMYLSGFTTAYWVTGVIGNRCMRYSGNPDPDIYVVFGGASPFYVLTTGDPTLC